MRFSLFFEQFFFFPFFGIPLLRRSGVSRFSDTETPGYSWKDSGVSTLSHFSFFPSQFCFAKFSLRRTFGLALLQSGLFPPWSLAARTLAGMFSFDCTVAFFVFLPKVPS